MRISISTGSRAASFIAAYAFVLNTMLASLLLSTMPLQASTDPVMICASMQDASSTDQGDGAKIAWQQAAAHCKQCCANHAGSAVPPAVTASFARTAVSAPQHTAFARELKRYARFTQHPPRGPPTLI